MKKQAPRVHLVSHGVLLLALGGCTLSPSYQTPQIETGNTWQTEVGATIAQPDVPANWWTLYQNPALTQLVETALANNTNVQAAAARVTQARAQLTIATAPLLPSANASLNASDNLSDGSGAINSSARGSIGYELDLFGGNRAAREASRQSLRGTEYAEQATRLAVAGDTATGYFALLTLTERVRLAEESLAKISETFALTQQRFNAGVASGLDVAQQQTQLASTQASIANLRQQRQAAQNALAILTGSAPNLFNTPAGTLAETTLPVVAPQTPAAVILQRPDIQQAEASLRGANANIGVARANLFPQLNLSLDALLGIDPATTAITAGAGLAQTIFAGGSRWANVTVSQARREELIATYRGTVLAGFGEVENALSALNTATIRKTQLQTSQQAAQKAEELSRQRFNVGAIDMLTLLDSQRSLLSANDGLAQAENDYATATVQLIRALGGGWK